MLLACISNHIFIDLITLYYLVDCIVCFGWLFFKEVFLDCLFGFCFGGVMVLGGFFSGYEWFGLFVGLF